MNQRMGRRGRQGGNRSPGQFLRGDHQSQRGPPESQLPLEGLYANPALSHALASLVGCVVEVQLHSGKVCEGVLRTTSPHMDVVLEVARLHSSGSEREPLTSENVVKTMELSLKEIVSISAHETSNPSMGNKDIFKTDSEISRTNGPSGSRELQPFTDFSSDASLALDGGEGGDRGWNFVEMMAVNQEKFQVKSSFDEAMPQYTTQITESEDFSERQARASRLAQEMEGKRSLIDDSGTEEERFSSVVRLVATTGSTSSSDGAMLVSVTTATTTAVSEGEQVDEGISRSLSPPEAEAGQISDSAPSHLEASSQGGEEGQSEEGRLNEAAEPPRQGTEESEGVEKEKEKSTEGDSPDHREHGETGRVEEVPAQKLEPETKVKETAIKNFKLDPNVKEFIPTAFPSPAPPTTAASPSPGVSSTLVQMSPSPSHHPTTPTGGRKPYSKGPRYPRMHGHTLLHQEQPMMLTPSTGYVFSTGQPVVSSAGLLLPGQMYSAGGMSQYPMPTGFMGQGVLATPQVVSGSPIHTHPPQLIGPMTPAALHQAQLLAQQAQGSILPTVSQPQMMPTPQGLVSTPSQQQLIYMQTAAAAAAMTAGLQHSPPTMAIPTSFIPAQHAMGGLPPTGQPVPRVLYQLPAAGK